MSEGSLFFDRQGAVFLRFRGARGGVVVHVLVVGTRAHTKDFKSP